MERLLKNSDFIMLVEDFNTDRRALNAHLLNENSSTMTDNLVKTRLIARINQIDSLVTRPRKAIRVMKALKEVREVIDGKNSQLY